MGFDFCPRPSTYATTPTRRMGRSSRRKTGHQGDWRGVPFGQRLAQTERKEREREREKRKRKKERKTRFWQRMKQTPARAGMEAHTHAATQTSTETRWDMRVYWKTLSMLQGWMLNSADMYIQSNSNAIHKLCGRQQSGSWTLQFILVTDWLSANCSQDSLCDNPWADYLLTKNPTYTYNVHVTPYVCIYLHR